MHKVTNRRVDIAEDHEANGDLNLSREEVYSEEVEAHDENAVGDRLDQRPPSCRHSLTGQLSFPPYAGAR